MKRLVSILFILQFFFAGIGVVYGNQNTVKMTMDGKTVTFQVIGLKVDGQVITSEVPPVLYNERTLVPLRAIMEHTGATVTWDQENYQVGIVSPKSSILLKIDSEVAMVNGNAVRLSDDVPAKLINNKTMVPIRFVAEALGMEVGWEDKTRTVLLTSIQEETPTDEPDDGRAPEGPQETLKVEKVTVNNGDDLPEIRIKTSGKAEYSEMVLSNPTRLVFDFKNTLFDIGQTTYTQPNGSYSRPFYGKILKAVRLSQFSKEPDVTRLVLELNAETGYDVKYDESSKEWVLSFKNYVTAVKSQMINGKEVIVIEGDFVENYHVMDLENPKRLVVDIKDAYLNTTGLTQFTGKGNLVKTVRVAQFSPDEHYKPGDKIVRVVMDLADQTSYPEPYIEIKEHQIWVHVEGAPYTQLSYEETGWTTSRLTMRGEKASGYTVNKDAAKNLVEVRIPKTVALEYNQITIGDHMIKEIKVDSSPKDYYRVNIYLEKDVTLTPVTTGKADELVLDLKNSNRYRDFLVVIDPGHGGSAPGASSPTLKLKEKDVVLEVSLYLNQMLKEAGFRTFMTRSDDTTVDTKDRPVMANQLNADLFVSVHANAVEKNMDQVSGIETLYYPTENNPNDNRDNKRLAQIIQEELIAKLGGKNRGIVKRELLYVIRETKMPAILAEIGFLTHPEEEKKLATSEYRKQVAEALFNGIVRYFEETHR